MSLNDKLSNSSASSGYAAKPKSNGPNSIADSIKESTASKAKVPPPYASPQPEKEGCLGPLMAALALVLLLALCYKGCSYAMNSYKKSKPSTVTTETSLSPAEMDDIENSDTINQSVAELNAGAALNGDNPQTCVIITGVFSDYRNVNRMEKMLETKGYIVYQEEYGPYTRVGLEFDCIEEDLVDYIQKIRSSIPHAKKAWYLKPEMHVDY